MTAPNRNRFHALCPYFAMFPESFAEVWVDRLTMPGQVVLDPFCGRGTTPFQSLLMRRRVIGCDINPVAYCVTRAKTNGVSAQAVRKRLSDLESRYVSMEWHRGRKNTPTFFRMAYSPRTLQQLLYLRETLNWKRHRTDCMIAALVLGSLHGESNRSPSYLSNQMPRTISTKPNYSVRFWQRHGYKAPQRDVFELLRDMISFRYQSQLPCGDAEIHNDDMRNLPTVLGPHRNIRCVITSPPYFDVTDFEEDQWLRLWFLGGPPCPTRNRLSRDDRHESAGKYWSFIADMWRMFGEVLAKEADIVIRIGTGRLSGDQLAHLLAACGQFSKRRTSLVSQEQTPLRRRQTDAFRPGSSGCRFEIDCHFRLH